MRFTPTFCLASISSISHTSASSVSSREVHEWNFGASGDKPDLIDLSLEIDKYNNLVQQGEAALKKVNDPYILTLYNVICGLSIASEYDIDRGCKQIEGLTFQKIVKEHLTRLLNKAHSHADEERLDDEASLEFLTSSSSSLFDLSVDS
jgi:hypothetical protein